MSLFANQNEIVHLYNQGNNRKKIFNDRQDYLKFLSLFRKFVSTHCTVIAYCLMPNHYHFEMELNESGVVVIPVGSLEISRFGNGVRILQSMYAKYYNTRYRRSGSLFRQKAKLSPCESTINRHNHSLIVFEYIHKNPVRAGLVEKADQWPYSSLQEYMKKTEKNIVDTDFLGDLLSIDIQSIIEDQV